MSIMPEISNTVITDSSLGRESSGVLPKLHSRAVSSVKARVWLSSKLDILVPSSQRLEVFAGRRPTILSKFELLKKGDPDARIQFVLDVAEHALTNRKVRGVLASNLCQMSHFLSRDEKATVIETLLQDRRIAGASSLIGQILMSSPTRAEAVALIRRVGYETLFDRRSQILKEVIAVCFLGKQIMKIPLPPPCSKFASHPILLRKKFEAVKLSLNEAIARTNTSEFKGTSARREYNLAFRRALKDFEAEFKSAKNGGEKREVINAAILRYKVEARFCLSLSSSKASTGVEARRWKSAEIASLQETLIAKSRFEGPLLFTPKIFEIKRVSKFLGEHADSDATHDDMSGCIELTDVTFLDPHAKSGKKNSAYLAYFILHELGHAFSTSLMRSYKEIRSSGSQNDFLGYIFGDDFFDLSGWQIVRSGYKIVDNGYSVKIGRNQYTLGSLVEVDGKIREYRYNSTYRTLYFHRGKGNYPGSYSRTDPYEDWADTFADYARRPKRLIDRSPEKFQYMEGLFRIYDADKSVQEYVRAHNPIAKIRTRVDTLTQSSEHLVPLKMFGRLSLLERHCLASSGARNQELKSLPLVDVLRSIEGVDEESLMRQFIRRLDKQPQAVRADLEGILKLYNPAVLKALTVLEKGHRVAIFADRGDVSLSHQNTEPAQNPLRQGLSMFLGDQFDPSRLYLLSDPLKSSRLNKSTNPEKAAALLAEFARGASIRGSLVKPLHHSVDHVYYYDAFPQRNSQIAKMVREEGLLSKLTFINILQYSSEDLASQLLRSVPGTVRNELHVFALDNCLINLAPRYRITFRDSAKVLREVKFNEFLLKPDPDYWITNSLALLPEIPKRTLRSRLQWDDSDFFDLSRAREQIRVGLEFNRMFRRVTG